MNIYQNDLRGGETSCVDYLVKMNTGNAAEKNGKTQSAWDEDEPIYENGNLFLDGEIEEIEKERGYPMEELYEGDLLEIVEEQKGIMADSAEWNGNWECIEYRYRVA